MKMFTVFMMSVSALALTGWDRAESDWTLTKQTNTIAAYQEFHRKHPHSMHLTSVIADVECSQNLSISMGSGLSGTASLASLNVDVNGSKGIVCGVESSWLSFLR